MASVKREASTAGPRVDGPAGAVDVGIAGDVPVASAANTAPGSSRDLVADEEPIQRFASWTRRYLAASETERPSLEREGVALAAARRPVMKQLIQEDPQRALERVVPRVVRQQLPASIVAQLENPVSHRGDYNVYLGKPAPGVAVPAKGLVLRYFETEGASYKAHVFGGLAHVMSRRNFPLQGYALDRELAVAPNAVRRLEEGERIPKGVIVQSTCPVSGLTTEAVSEGQTVTSIAPTVEIAGTLITLCNGSHVTVLEDDYRTYVQASGPGGGGFFMDNFPGTSSRAIGNFRCLYIRVTYPDQMQQPNTVEQAYADMRGNARYYLEGSYGKMTQTSTVTSVLTLPHTVAWYKAKDEEVDGLGLVHTDSRNAAKAAGYDPAQYDCVIVRVNQGPRLEGISWGGGTSVWITWDGMDVLNHECGHSLGRGHANSWDSLDGTPQGHGENGEYGNPFDVMGGGGGFDAHYNTISKRALGWLPDGYLHFPKGDGVYRIYAYDQPTLEEGKRYGLTVAKDSVRQYNIEYHPAAGGFLADNALVLYSGMGSNAGHLLDTTQGSLKGKDDGGIAIGRTYSDPEADMHFTVLGKNNTTPPSLDIAYNRGPFPGNVAPAVVLSASATSVAVGGSITFTATASDANGDPLAYEWLFDDGVGGTNSPSFTRAFTSAARRTAMVTVSDLKGGATRRSITITVGAPTTQNIVGTILDGATPLQGVLVSNGSRWCYSNADGTYTLANLATGATTLTATLAGHTFTPSLANPVTVISGTNRVDWTATASTRVTLAKINDASEGGASGTFRLSRTGDTAANLSVQVSPVGGTATKGTDYTFAPDHGSAGSFKTFTIPAGAATLDIIVAPANDTAAEGPETITLQLAGATGYLPSGPSLVVMTLADNDTTLPQVRVASLAPYAFEGPSPVAGSFTFSRLGDSSSPLDLAVTWSGTATNGTDYAPLPDIVTIPAGQSSVNIDVTPGDDLQSEAPEDVVVTIGANAAYVRDSSATSATVRLTDDDTPFVTVSVPDATASEGAGDAGVFLLTRSGDTAAALKVYYGLSGGALHGTDYAMLTGEVIIPAGAASAPVVISPYDDEVGEPDETVTLAVANFNNSYSIGTPYQGTITIKDNGDTPLVNVRAGSSGTEGGTNATVIFRSIGTGTGNIVVNYTVGGTAASGVDFTALSGAISVPVNGSNDTSLTIPIINDAFAESTETVVIKISPSADYRVHDDGAAEAIILDNDSGADRVSVSTNNKSPSEAGTAAGTFYFSRRLTTGDLTVGYSIGGAATNGVDYQALAGTVVIPDGQSGVDVVMTPIDDALAEGAETVTLTVLPGTGYGVDRPASATFEIVDNETPAVTVGFAQTSLLTSELPGASGEYRDLAVTLSAASANTVTVRYTGAGGSATGDDVDWALIDPDNGNVPIAGGVLTFLPGMTSRDIRVRIKADGVREPAETAVVQLLAPLNASVRSGKGQQSISIFDDAIPPLVTEERWNAGTVYSNNRWNTVTPDYTGYLTGFTSGIDVANNFSRRITGQIVAPATGTYVFWIASDDASRLYLSTTSNAANKVQIASLSGWTDFQNWDANASQRSANIVLAAGQSYYLEVQHQEGGGGDHVSVAWEGPGFARTPIVFTAPDTAPRTVSMLTPGTTRLEADGTEALLQVVLDRPAGATPITVDYAASGTATPGEDYALSPGTITFAAGEQMKAIPLTLLPDAVGEGVESIVVALSSPAGASLASPATHTITLLDAATPVVETQFVGAASTQAANTIITTATVTSGHAIANWTIVGGDPGGAFAISANGQIRLAAPSALPNPGGLQLVVRATADNGASADGVINVICNAGATPVVEQRWSGDSAFWSENWTGTPSHTGKLATLSTAQGVGENYSRRLIGYLRPATSGDYTFWIAGDDDCRLYLSRDGYQANKTQIASVDGWTGFQSWEQRGAQKSASIPLVAGGVYWIEAQQREGGGGDHVSVAWSGPGITRAVIPTGALLPTAPGIDFVEPSTSLPNTPPTISAVAGVEIDEDSATGAILFTVGDAETNAASLSVAASSSNHPLVPGAGIVLGGSGAERTVNITPSANTSGSATISLVVSDGVYSSVSTFVLLVAGSNDSPTITPVANQTLALNSSTPALPFGVGDTETAATALTVSVSSSNPALVPPGGVVIHGGGVARTVVVTPGANQAGTATVTLGVNDGATTTTTSFLVTVPGTPVQLWRQHHFGSVLASGAGADDADPDGDGVDNLLEYALGLDPGMGSVLAQRITADLAEVAGALHLRLAVAKNPAASEVGFSVEVSDDLANPASWTSAGTVVEVDTGTTLVVRDATPLGADNGRFLRLRVTGP